MTKDEAMKLALEALENAPIEYDFHGNPMDAEFGKQLDAAVQALRQALEQTDQGPDAWWCGGSVSTRKGYFEEMGWAPIKPLYTSPPSKPWVSLTDEEIVEGAKQSWAHFEGIAPACRFDLIAFESAVWWAEEKLKEKNRG